MRSNKNAFLNFRVSGGGEETLCIGMLRPKASGFFIWWEIRGFGRGKEWSSLSFFSLPLSDHAC